MAKNKFTDPLIVKWFADLETLRHEERASENRQTIALARAITAWEQAGGCKPCDGTGSVRFGFSDDSWEESCRDCRGVSEAGRRPGVYDLDIGFRRALAVARENLHHHTHAPDKGEIALVIKGRKVQPGLYGIVLKVTEGKFGERSCLFLPNQTTVWIALENLRFVTLPSELEGDLRIAKACADEAFREKKEAELAPARQVEAQLPALIGSPAQVKWALDLRLKALASGMDLERAKQRTSAKAWIESR